jgi:hypothetical protein
MRHFCSQVFQRYQLVHWHLCKPFNLCFDDFSMDTLMIGSTNLGIPWVGPDIFWLVPWMVIWLCENHAMDGNLKPLSKPLWNYSS